MEFFATSHRKGPSDGLGEIVERLAAWASWQLPPKDQIQTPLQFFEWSQKNTKGINIEFAKKDHIEAHRLEMSKRFQHAIPITGIRGSHSSTLARDGYVDMKKHSLQDHGVLFNVAEMYDWAKSQLPTEPISTR